MLQMYVPSTYEFSFFLWLASIFIIIIFGDGYLFSTIRYLLLHALY